jgi:hypothetical protein
MRSAPVSARWIVPMFLAVTLAASVLLPNAAVVTTTAGVVSAPRAAEGAWVRARSAAGIVIFRQTGATASDRSVRAEADVAEALLVVASLVLDLRRAPEWCSGVTELATERSLSETDYILLAHVASARAADQTVLVAARLSARRTPSRVEIELRPPTDLGAPGDKGTRGGLSSANLRLTSVDGGLRTHVTFTVHCDADSANGTWCTDQLGVDGAFATMSGLRAVVSKGGIEVLPRLEEVLEEGATSSGDGPSYESVLSSYNETVAIGASAGSRDLTQAELAAPLAQAPFVSSCGAPEDMKVAVRVAVHAGRAVGVTVSTDPRSRAVASCIDRAVRRLRWAPSPKTDFLTTSY